MNSKAARQQIELQFNLNLYDDNPHVDNNFSNVEKNNAPFLNDMLQPVWIKQLDREYIHDAEGNAYYINDENMLVKGDTPLFEVKPEKLVKTDVTDEFSEVVAFDMDDAKEVRVYWDTDNNRYRVVTTDGEGTTRSEYYTESLFSEGTVIAVRVKLIDGIPWLIVHYDIADDPYLLINRNGETLYNDELHWYKQTARRNTSATVQSMFSVMDIENADTIIHIGEVTEGVTGISLVSDRNRAINTSKNGFATFFVEADGTVKQLGKDIFPTSTTSSTEVTNTRNLTVRIQAGSSRVPNTTGTCLSTDQVTYYDYTEAGVLGNDLHIPVSYTPEDTGETVTINDIEYKKYSYSATKYVYTTVVQQQGTSESFKASATITTPDGEETVTSDTDTAQKLLTVNQLVFGTDYEAYHWKDVTITWNEEDSTIAMADLPKNGLYTVTQEYKTTVNAGWIVTPNIVLDDGKLYAMYYFPDNYTAASSNGWGNQTITAGNLIEESGFISAYTGNEYTIGVTEFVQLTSDYNVIRANSVIALQNLFVGTVRLNNASALSSAYMYNDGGTARAESTSALFLEYVNSNASDLRYYPGTSNDNSFNYFGYIRYNGQSVGPTEDCPPFVVQGYRVPVNNTQFNLCYNVINDGTASLYGISYSEGTELMGTLLTTWTSINQDFYVAANSTSLVYKDVNNQYWKITIEEGNVLTNLIDDRYILVNTTSYWNMYDSFLRTKLHYATDYNGRLMYGQSAVPRGGSITGTGGLLPGTSTYSRVTADAINAGYSIAPRNANVSMLLPYTTRSRALIDAEKPFRCYVEESTHIQPIDIYYGDVGENSNPSYRYSLYPYTVYNRKYRFELDRSYYGVSSAMMNLHLFAEIVSGAGNYDMVRDGTNAYVLYYYNQQPYLMYRLASEAVAIGKNTEYFVLQGQFYSHQNDKIYSMIYSNGTIAQQDAIVDCRGMIFLGNNTQIAFFYSPSKRYIYSFTGDAILQTIYPASKIKSIQYQGHWYDEVNQIIYVSTDYGLLVFGQKNNYIYENWKNVSNVQVSRDSVTHITNDGKTIDLVYYRQDGYEVLPLDLETSFFGLGSNEYTSIDRWDITLFDNNHTKPESYITVGVRSITDVTVKSEEKTFKITPEMYDKWSDSVLIRYVPKLQKGQGIRLYVKTPLTVQKIVPHVMDMATGTLTKRGL